MCGIPWDPVPVGTHDGKDEVTAASLIGIKTVFIPTGIAGLDRILGGGVVEEDVVLLGGSKGTGKSTLAAQACDGIARPGRKALYASAEESDRGLAKIINRCGINNPNIVIMGNAADADEIVERAEHVKAALLVVDSLQGLTVNDVKGNEGSDAQGKAITHVVTAYCKRTKTSAIIINQMTKDMSLTGGTGPAHTVETVAEFTRYYPYIDGELDSDSEIDDRGIDDKYQDEIRMLVCPEKNRNGPTNKPAYFYMDDKGKLVDVPLKRRSRLHSV